MLGRTLWINAGDVAGTVEEGRVVKATARTEGHAMKRHTITLASGRVVTVGDYVQAVRFAKSNPLMMFRHGFSTWWPCDGAAILYQFRQGMHDRLRQRAAARPYDQLPRHERYLWLLRETTDAVLQRMLPPELRRDANPRIVGEQADNIRSLYLWRARREAQRAIRAGRAS